MKVEKILSTAGFEKRTVVCFDLPTEHLNSKTTVTSNKGLVTYVMRLGLPEDQVRLLRNLRANFYNFLHRNCFKAPLGWITLKDVDYTTLHDYMKQFNSILKPFLEKERIIELVDIYLPKHQTVVWLKQYIKHVKADIEKLNEKLQENQEKVKVAQQIKWKINRQIKILKKLEAELRSMGGA